MKTYYSTVCMGRTAARRIDFCRSTKLTPPCSLSQVRVLVSHVFFCHVERSSKENKVSISEQAAEFEMTVLDIRRSPSRFSTVTCQRDCRQVKTSGS